MQKMEDNLYFGGHLVAVIDILGQSNKLSELKKIKWWELNQETISVLQDTYGNVLKFRKIFDDFLSKYCKLSALDKVFQELSSPEQLRIWNQFDKKRIITRGFSDSFIMTFPLIITNGLIPLKSIYGVLGACASSMLVSLNYKFAVRGGIEIGPCIFNSESQEVYGSALNDAVRYEKEADWIRILIGPELVRYLNECVNLPPSSITYQINCQAALRCLTLITQDESGRYFLDYLSPNYSELRNFDKIDVIIDGALTFIDNQIEQFHFDEKVRSKYIKLKSYFESRIQNSF